MPHHPTDGAGGRDRPGSEEQSRAAAGCRARRPRGLSGRGVRGDRGRRPLHGRARGALRAAAPLLLTLLCVFVFLLGLTSLAFGAQAAAGQEAGAVWLTRVEGIIDPALANYLVDVMADAADANAAALVIEIDTPGGLDSAMREIIQAEIDSPIPIVFYVFPQGARAASAGVYILYGSDVAAMAPQTNLGAATPVSLTGDMDEDLRNKVVNDAAAYIIGLANSHERNAEWAEQAVREAVSLPAEDALDQDVIEFVAPDLNSLLAQIDGYVTVPKGLTLQTAGAPIHEVSMGWIARFLHLIANPDVAYILLTLGVLGIIMEFSTPGFGASGIAGVIAIILGLYSFQVLPVNWAGFALVILAVILLVAELFVQSSGVLGIAGVAALILGGLLLFDTTGAPFLRVNWVVLAIAGIFVLAFFFLVISKAAKAIRQPHATGMGSMVGETGVVVSPLTPEGMIKVRGEIWRARSQGGDLPKDQAVEIVAAEGLTLIVRPVEAPSEASPPLGPPGAAPPSVKRHSIKRPKQQEGA